MNNVQTQILQTLAGIETQHGVRILYACESGSRAWGFPSPDSDYDVRFFYVHPSERYFELEEPADELGDAPDELWDFKGWDLRKALRLMRASNATPYEWVQSPIVYRAENGFQEKLTALTPQYFSPRAGVQHYLGLTMKTWKTALQSGEVRLKKYFYALRPLLAAMFILDRGTVPPMEFAPLLASADLSADVQRAIAALLHQKKDASESATMPPDPVLHAFIADTLAQCHRRAAEVPSLRADAADANAFFRKMVNAV